MMKRIILCAVALVCCIIGLQAQTQIIAHRGFWKTEGSAQNSITALEKATQGKLYGSEFDVHLLADGNLAVIHDSNLKRITGADVFVPDHCGNGSTAGVSVQNAP